jgi:hypothetical protein
MFWRGDYAPTPVPEPEPSPIVDPSPKPVDDTKPIKDAWLLVVYESEDNDANFLSIYENKPYREALKGRGLQPYFQDIDVVAPVIESKTQGLDLPVCMVIEKGTDNVTAAFTLPAGGPEALDAELKKRVGK